MSTTTTPHTQTAYKDTSIGKIPADWEVKRFIEFSSFFSGGTPLTSRPEYYGGQIPFIKSGEIYFDTTEQFLTDIGLKESSAKLVDKGDLLFALYGANSGEVAISKIKGAINQAVLCIKQDKSIADTVFLYNFLLNHKNIIIQKYLQGGQGNLSAEIVKNIQIPLPPLPEQKRIAEVLSTWDQAIQLTEQLIRQKEQRKKWLMQQLLTGKKRLFSSDDLGDISYELQKVKLGDLIKLASGDTKPNDTNQFFTSTYAFPVYGGNGIMCYSKEFNSSDERIIIGRVGEYCGVTRIVFQKCWITDNALYTNKIDDSVSILYLFYKLQFEDLSKLRSVAGQPLVSQKPIYNLSLLIHRSKHEQTAIAEVLQTADKEIELLKAKAEKLKEQKKGLMQQLLTGKKRMNEKGRLG